MVLKTRRKLSAKGEQQRQRIFQAAEKIFLDKGFGNASMREIASLAGIEQGLMTYYFKNKTDLYMEGFTSKLTETLNVQLSDLDLARKEPLTVESILYAYARHKIEGLAAGKQHMMFLIQMVEKRGYTDVPDEIFSNVDEAYATVRRSYLQALSEALGPTYKYPAMEWAFEAYEGLYIAVLTRHKEAFGCNLLTNPQAVLNNLVKAGCAVFQSFHKDFSTPGGTCVGNAVASRKHS